MGRQDKVKHCQILHLILKRFEYIATNSLFPLVVLGAEDIKYFTYWDLCNVHIDSS